jgi:hypothetical protein
MQRRGLLAVPVLLASMALGAPAASADDALKMYRTTVDDEKVGVLGDLGVDVSHTGYDRSVDRAQTHRRARRAPRASPSRRSPPVRT